MAKFLEMARFSKGVTDFFPYHAGPGLSGSFPLLRQRTRAEEGAGRSVGGLDRRLSDHSTPGKAARQIRGRVVVGVVLTVRIRRMHRQLRNEQQDWSQQLPMKYHMKYHENDSASAE